MDNNNEKKVNLKVPSDMKNIHTYQSDVAEASRENNVSISKIILAEQKRKEKEEVYQKAEGTSATKTIWVVCGILLIALSVGGYYFVFSNKEAGGVINNPARIATGKENSFIPYDEKKDIDVTDIVSSVDALNLINKEGYQNENRNHLKIISFNKTSTSGFAPITALDWFSLIGSTAPSSLIRSFDDSYIIGSYLPVSVEKTTSIFLMFKTKNYSATYASMLTWEKTMLDDLFSIFNINVANDNKYLSEEPWKDVIIMNKDARALYDKNNNPILYYLFLDRNYLIITDKEDTIKEVAARLIIKNTKPL